MNRLFYATLVGTALAAALHTAAMAGPFEDALAADARGDNAQAFVLLRDAADKGDAKAQFALGEKYRQSQGALRDLSEAARRYQQAALQGNPGAQFSLGSMFEAGQGVARSDAQAAAWYLKAAQNGFATAQVRLGVLYEEGRGAPRALDQAAAWYRKAADQGDAEGQFRLGLILSRDNSTPRERFAAMMDGVFGPGKWRETSGFRTVAQEDALRAQGAGTVPMGTRSRHSMGTRDAPGAYDVVVDRLAPQAAAAKLLRAKAPVIRVVAEGAYGDQGPHLHIEPLLAEVARPGSHGLGKDLAPAEIVRDDIQAADWCRKAAEQGLADAQFALASMYQSGQGVPRDPAEAARWYLKAAGQGHAKAIARLQALGRANKTPGDAYASGGL